MPNRIIKESITTSETLAKLSGDEERHFWRLIVQADDYGYLDARPEVIRAKGYAMMLDTIAPEKLEVYTLGLAKVGLLHLFLSDGKRYGHFPTWEKHQQIRAKRHKYPPVTSCEGTCNQLISCDITCQQVLASAPVIQSESNPNPNPESNPNPKRESGAKAPFVLPEWVDKSLWESFMEIRKKKRAPKTKHALDLLVGDLDKIRVAGGDMCAALEQSIKRGYTGIFPVKDNGGNDGRANGITGRNTAPNSQTVVYKPAFEGLGKRPNTMLPMP